MYSIITLCCFIGFFQVYNTSAKAKLSSSGSYEKWLQGHRATAKYTGCLLLLTSLTALIIKDGSAVGVFTFIILLMAAACCIVALAPLQYFKLKHIALIFLSSFLIEIMLFA